MNKDFARALDLFHQLGTDPLQVIGLYPNLLPRNLRKNFKYPFENTELTGDSLEKGLQALKGLTLG